MNRRLLFVVSVVTLLAAPALFACETCIPKGVRDPNGGGPYGSALCWTSSSGILSYCWGGDLVCTGADPENSCPTAGGGGCTIACPENPELRSAAVDRRCDTVDVSGRCTDVRRNHVSFLR